MIRFAGRWMFAVMALLVGVTVAHAQEYSRPPAFTQQELDRMLMENPLLELEEPAGGRQSIVGQTGPTDSAPSTAQGEAPEPGPAEHPLDAQSTDLDWFASGAPSSSGPADDDEGPPTLAAEPPSLRNHLLDQVNLLNLDTRDKTLVALLVDALDENGYLTMSLEEVHEGLPSELEIHLDELHIALKHLQQLEPTGIGARNAGECLVLQLEALPAATPGRELAEIIARDHLEWLAMRDFVRLRKALGCNDQRLREAQQLIQSLDPRPGAAFANNEARYVVPDVIVRKVKGVWLASLNSDALPRLRINSLYADILKGGRGAPASQLSQQLQEARWLIKNVQQRFETILRVSQAIIDRQRHFFEHGEVAMRPLVLREIADLLGLHEIGRAHV